MEDFAAEAAARPPQNSCSPGLSCPSQSYNHRSFCLQPFCRSQEISPAGEKEEDRNRAEDDVGDETRRRRQREGEKEAEEDEEDDDEEEREKMN